MRMFVFLSTVVCLGLLSDARAADARPNIVLILADDLGYGDLGCYGQKRIQTPHLDRMAAEGMRFTQFYAGSTVCAPSRCVLMTGLHTGHALIRGNGKDNLRPEDVTIAKILKQSGYACGLAGKWGLGHEGSTGLPTRQGFDTFFGYLDQHHAHNYYPAFLIEDEARVKLPNVVPGEGEYGQGVASEKVEYSPPLITSSALEFIDEHHARPFFLYFAATLPHANNEGGGRGMEIPEYGQYASLDWPEPQKAHAAMIGHLDQAVGQVFERLKKHGIDENTIVLFSSDNGPHREGGNDPDFNDSNGALRGIKRDLTDGGIRVPMLVRWPTHVAAGSTSDHVGYFADMLPTLAELAEATPPSETDGIGFVPTLLGHSAEQKQHDALYWEFYERPGGSQAVRMGPWKAIRMPMGDRGTVELYDVTKDVGEATNVAAMHPDVVARAVAIMDREHVASARWRAAPDANGSGAKSKAGRSTKRSKQ